jgi:triacylglycerol esterase/lipase EstA (alpha/beta hydrolase family)
MKPNVKLIFLPILALVLGACSSSPKSVNPLSSGSSHSLRGATSEELEQALADVDRVSTAGLQTKEDRLAYATATERVVALWLSLSDEKSRSQPLAAGDLYRLESSWPRNLRFDELIPANSIKGKRLKHRITREGVGVPFVAHWNYTSDRKAAEHFMSDGGYVSSVTATIEFRRVRNGPSIASLRLHDSRVIERVRLNGRELPLAADLTTFGEYIMSKKKIQMAGLKALLRSSRFMDKLGLLALEHPDEDRIPLVLVHGLMSRPATWENVINEFGADSVIQKYYQVYLFRYPSGVPIIYSSARLREELAKLHATLEKRDTRMLSHHMVLIGHSMGGLVSKAQVQESGDRLWVNLLGDTPQNLDLTMAERDALSSFMEFDPNPSVSRVIFAATPHRGSKVADTRLAHFGRRLVSLPGRTFGATFDILEGIASRDQKLGKLLANGMPTSVDNLSPGSPYVKIATSLPFRSGVHLHSIIGNKEGKLLTDPECSDGFVPYSSSHLNNVESEFIVRSDHSVHEKPEAIEEMRRILQMHLKALGLN